MFKRVVTTGLRIGLTSRRYINIPTKGIVRLENTKFLKISGKDASVFINGLTTIKLLPQFNKKNQTTISESDVQNESISSTVDLDPNDIETKNWGILNECEEFDSNDPKELPLKLGIRRDGRFGLILKSNGRVFSDVFIYPTPFINQQDNYPSYLIEVLNKTQFNSLKLTLNLHKLKSKVQIEEVNANSFFYYNDLDDGLNVYDSLIDLYFSNLNSKNVNSANFLASKFLKDNVVINSEIDATKILGFAVDQRTDYFGLRIITNLESPNDFLSHEIPTYPSDIYNIRRIHNGIIESEDFGNNSVLPFEMNIDWMRGINYNKGCYMGQELTIRTWSKDNIIKRVLPIRLDESIPGLNMNSKYELKSIDEPVEIIESVANNPFGSKSVKTRKDLSKVGLLLINDGEFGLARIDKRYFDWNIESSKNVKIVSDDGNEYLATIDMSIWN